MNGKQSKLDKVMEQVQQLIARADHPNTPPAEAELSRERAEILMFRYKIEAITTESDNSTPSAEPVWRKLWVAPADNEFLNYYASITDNIIRHVDARGGAKYEQRLQWNEAGTDPTGTETWLVYDAVGFEGDLRYAEMLVTSAIVAFSKTLEPKFHHDESHAANALRLRRGGMERHRIARLLFGDSETQNEQKAKNRKVTRLIKQEADRLGKPELAEEVLGRGTSIKTFRRSYAAGFYSTLVRRLREMSVARGQAGEGTVVLANLKERIDEAFYEKYPAQRPSARPARRECAKCAAAKSGYCREHSFMRPRRGRLTNYSQSAIDAGSRAAASVDLGPAGKGRLGR